MDSDSVYRYLQDKFPQVDVRLLRVVAVEKPIHDLQAAVESVKEVLHTFEKKAAICSSVSGAHSHKLSVSHQRQAVSDTYPLSSGSAPASDGANESGEMDESLHAAPIFLNETDCKSSESTFHDAKDNNDQSVDCTNKDASLSDTYIGISSELDYNFSTSVSPVKNKVNEDIEDGLNGGDGNSGLQKYVESDSHLVINNTLQSSTSSSDSSDYVHDISELKLKASYSSDPSPSNISMGIGISQEKQPSASSNSAELGSFVELETNLKSNAGDINNSCLLTHVPVEDQVHEAPENIHLEFDHHAPSSSVQIIEYGLSMSDTTSKQVVEFPGHTNNDDSPLVNSIVTRSGQVSRIDLLEDIIDDSKSHKKRLFSAMEIVMKLMREVEVKEKDAEQAKEEAARGGLEILASVDKLKQMIKAAVEAKEMHSGEVYGERAILATEVKELQNRLFNLAEERDRQLSILDEMRVTLEARRDAAEKEVMVAEIEKLEKEQSARDALAEQEYIMEKVVEESKILQLEAEENGRLREFLDGRGRIVDTLQGEISVICQDVKLLKENFDERIPLSQYLSSKQTSCILAASSSSSATMKSSILADKPDNWLVSSEKTESNCSDDACKVAHREEVSEEKADSVSSSGKISSDDDWEAV